MCSTCSGSGPAFDLHCVSADMDVNRKTPYFGPVEDEKTAIEKSVKNLRDIEVRSLRAAAMCYALSSDNEDKSLILTYAGAAASGMMACVTGATASETIMPIFKSSLFQQSRYFKYLVGSGSAILVFAGMLTGIEKAISNRYEKKAEKFNEAAAEWQHLELRINAFLSAAVKDKMELENYKQFTEECAQKRKEICLIVCPDESVYKKHTSNVDLLIKRRQKLLAIHKKLEGEGLY